MQVCVWENDRAHNCCRCVCLHVFLLTGIRDTVVWHLPQETWAQFRLVPRSVCPAVGKHSPLLHPLLVRLASVKRADITNRQPFITQISLHFERYFSVSLISLGWTRLSTPSCHFQPVQLSFFLWNTKEDTFQECFSCFTHTTKVSQPYWLSKHLLYEFVWIILLSLHYWGWTQCLVDMTLSSTSLWNWSPPFSHFARWPSLSCTCEQPLEWA